jgi:hypothetical protein
MRAVPPLLQRCVRACHSPGPIGRAPCNRTRRCIAARAHLPRAHTHAHTPPACSRHPFTGSAAAKSAAAAAAHARALKRDRDAERVTGTAEGEGYLLKATVTRGGAVRVEQRVDSDAEFGGGSGDGGGRRRALSMRRSLCVI